MRQGSVVVEVICKTREVWSIAVHVASSILQQWVDPPKEAGAQGGGRGGLATRWTTLAPSPSLRVAKKCPDVSMFFSTNVASNREAGLLVKANCLDGGPKGRHQTAVLFIATHRPTFQCLDRN
jgi:hypothetical protein